jgi:hypothetical protein
MKHYIIIETLLKYNYDDVIIFSENKHIISTEDIDFNGLGDLLKLDSSKSYFKDDDNFYEWNKNTGVMYQFKEISEKKALEYKGIIDNYNKLSI